MEPIQRRQILNLQAVLEVQAEQTKTALAEIEPQILSVQKERQEATAAESLMRRDVEVAIDTHTALARTVEEKRITTQDTSTGRKFGESFFCASLPHWPSEIF